jgi:hypothetical protein
MLVGKESSSNVTIGDGRGAAKVNISAATYILAVLISIRGSVGPPPAVFKSALYDSTLPPELISIIPTLEPLAAIGGGSSVTK